MIDSKENTIRFEAPDVTVCPGCSLVDLQKQWPKKFKEYAPASFDAGVAVLNGLRLKVVFFFTGDHLSQVSLSLDASFLQSMSETVAAHDKRLADAFGFEPSKDATRDYSWGKLSFTSSHKGDSAEITLWFAF